MLTSVGGFLPLISSKAVSAEGEETRNNDLFLPSSQGSSTCSPGPGPLLAPGQTNAAAEECSLSTLTAALHTPTCGPQSTGAEWTADAIDSPTEDEGSESCLGEQISKIWPLERNAERRGEARPASSGSTGLKNQVPGLFQKKKENKRSCDYQVTWRLQLRLNALGTFRGAYLL